MGNLPWVKPEEPPSERLSVRMAEGCVLYQSVGVVESPAKESSTGGSDDGSCTFYASSALVHAGAPLDRTTMASHLPAIDTDNEYTLKAASQHVLRSHACKLSR